MVVQPTNLTSSISRAMLDYASRARAGLAADLFAEWFRSPMDWASTLVDMPALSSNVVQTSLVVYGNDHRGHGRTATSPENFGDFGPGGFALLVEDMARLTAIAKEERPEAPFRTSRAQYGFFRRAAIRDQQWQPYRRTGLVRLLRARRTRRPGAIRSTYSGRNRERCFRSGAHAATG